jgi:hypothetical protein
MRNEVEEALRRTDRGALGDDHLLAARLGAGARGAAVRHVEVLQLQSHGRHRRRDHGVGRVSKRVFELEDGVDPGLVDWARAYLDETIVGRRASATVVRRAFEDPGSRSRAALPRDDAPGVRRRRRHGDRALRRRRRRPARRRDRRRARGVPAAARGARAARGRARASARRARPGRPVVRVGPELEGEELHGASYVGATYGLPNRSLGAVGPARSRCGWTTRRRSARCAPQAFELSRLAEDVYGSS